MRNLTIGETIRHLRRVAGLTQKEVADQVGILRATYAAYEEDRAEPRITTIFAIARAVGLEPMELLAEIYPDLFGGRAPNCPADQKIVNLRIENTELKNRIIQIQKLLQR